MVVANGGDGATAYVDAQSLAVAHTTRLSGDADNLRYDARPGRVYVGYADGAQGARDSSL